MYADSSLFQHNTIISLGSREAFSLNDDATWSSGPSSGEDHYIRRNIVYSNVSPTTTSTPLVWHSGKEDEKSRETLHYAPEAASGNHVYDIGSGVESYSSYDGTSPGSYWGDPDFAGPMQIDSLISWVFVQRKNPFALQHGSAGRAETSGTPEWTDLYVGAVRPAVPPDSVADLLVEFVSLTQVILSWTAPGEDGSTGTAAEYDIRYSTSPITDANWTYATQVSNEGSPKEAGEDELLGVGGLSSCTTYYFAIKTRDAYDNWSALGRAPSQRTLCGGGGLAAIPVDPERNAEPAGAMALAQDQLTLDLAMVDSVPEWTASRTAHANLGEDDRLPGGVHVQVADGEGGWETCAHLVPTAADSLFGIQLPYADERRVVFSGDYSLRHIAGRTSNPSGAVVEVETVTSSRLGDVSDDVDPETGGVPEHELGDTLHVSYVVNESAEGGRFYVVVGGAPSGGATESRSIRVEPPAVPAVFALGQNQPNPMSATTTIRFDLPKPERVTLEIFDPQGRRVARLVDDMLPAGFHAVQWDRRGDGGALRPGVYLYRIQAGAFRDQKKLVILP